MANLANIIKNIDPPIELTQTGYNSLSTQQKNNGLYYVEDGNQVIQTASILETDNSNVQTELNSLNTNINNIITGSQYADTAQYLNTSSELGYYTDQYGNFTHKSSSATNNWAVIAYGGTGASHYPFRVYYQTGRITALNERRLVHGKGDNITLSLNSTGLLTSSGTRLVISIPVRAATSSASVTRITGFALLNNSGGYAYMKYGSNSFLALSSKQIWTNSAEAYQNSINSIATTVYLQEVRITIDFTTRLFANSTGTTNITNNIPIGYSGNFLISFT